MRPRPGYHVTAPRNWLNDPNAPILWRGTYHLFYQHNPAAPVWGRMHWGHTTSTDLVHWTDRGIALAPTDGADADGCWSGSAQIVDGRPVVHYTGATPDGRQVVLRAVGDEDLTTLTRDPATPVVPAEPGMGTLHQRDPFLVPYEGGWRMLLGTGLADENAGAVVAWESQDARSWRYAGVVYSQPAGGAGIETGPVWECPLLVEVDGRWVLIVSVQMPGPVCLHAVWFVGDFDGAHFAPSATGVLDAGDVFYAPSVAAGAGNRCLLWGWLQESVALRETGAEDFAGALSLPRELTVRDDRVVTRPARELEALWAEPAGLPAGAIPPEFRLRVHPAGLATIALGRDGDGRPVQLHVGDGALRVADRCAAAHGAVEIYVDHSIVEAFSEDGAALTVRVDPELDCREGVGVEGEATADIALRRGA